MTPEQDMQVVQAAQLLSIKSRFVYMPDESHWVIHGQTALVWQGEFYKWLSETLKLLVGTAGQAGWFIQIKTSNEF